MPALGVGAADSLVLSTIGSVWRRAGRVSSLVSRSIRSSVRVRSLRSKVSFSVVARFSVSFRSSRRRFLLLSEGLERPMDVIMLEQDGTGPGILGQDKVHLLKDA